MALDAPFFSLRGMAVPFNVAARCEGRTEFFDQHAFDEFLAGSPRVFLNFPEHDSAPVCASIALFAGQSGLFFHASIRAEAWEPISACVLTNFCFASIGGIRLQRIENDCLLDGEPCIRIAKAALDHVTICDETAIYRETGAWASPVNRRRPLSFRLARLDHEWTTARRRVDAVAAIAQMKMVAKMLQPTLHSAFATRRAEDRYMARIGSGSSRSPFVTAAAEVRHQAKIGKRR